MQQLSGQDALFLYADVPRWPMHIASVLWLDLPDACRPLRPFLEAHYAGCLDQFPTMRQVPVQDPWMLDHPYWVDDPNFNIDEHISFLPSGAEHTPASVRRLYSDFLGAPLQRGRPLWELLVVDGVRWSDEVPRATALFFKLHHAMMDGGTGIEMAKVMFDTEPHDAPMPRAPSPAPTPHRPPLPSPASLLGRALRKRALDPARIADLVARANKQRRGRTAAASEPSREPAVQAPRTPLNEPVGLERSCDAMHLPLSRLTPLATAVGGSINDVLLAACGRGLRRYFERRGELPSAPLVAVAPMSLHSDTGEHHTGSNQLTVMRCSLATDLDDPIEQLRAIQHATAPRKNARDKSDRRLIPDAMRLVPGALARGALRTYAGLTLSRHHPPIANVTISNVRLTDKPLYMGAGKLLGFEGSGPVVDGMGLLIAACGYVDQLSISLTACRRAIPDVERLTADILYAFDELEAALGAHSQRSAGTTAS